MYVVQKYAWNKSQDNAWTPFRRPIWSTHHHPSPYYSKFCVILSIIERLRHRLESSFWVDYSEQKLWFDRVGIFSPLLRLCQMYVMRCGLRVWYQIGLFRNQHKKNCRRSRSDLFCECSRERISLLHPRSWNYTVSRFGRHQRQSFVARLLGLTEQ